MARHIARVAARLFAARGYDATSVREIVEAAGVAKPTLYYYFKSKEGLASALLTVPLSSLVATLRQIVATVDEPVRCLEQVIEAQYSFCRVRSRPSAVHLCVDIWTARLGGCERPGAVPGQPTELDRGGGAADRRVGHRESGSNRRPGDRLPRADRHFHPGLSLSGPVAGRRPGAAAGRRPAAWLSGTGSGQRAGMRILRDDRRTQASPAGVAPARDDFSSRVVHPEGRGPRRGFLTPFGWAPWDGRE